MRDYLKYRLKKDTPFYKKGTEFCEDWFHKGVLLNDSCNVVANLNELDNPDEWFEEVKESNPLFGELTHDDRKDRVAVNIWFRKNRDGGHPKKMVNFIQFMEAINIVSQDEGFMVPYKTLGEMVYGFGISRDWYDTICAERNDHRIVAGQLYFDSEENAAKSVESHPEEWETILNYNWGKGGDDEN